MTVTPRHGPTAAAPRGSPLMLLLLLVGGWCALRVWWWEYPFSTSARAQAPPAIAATPGRVLPLSLPPEPSTPVTAAGEGLSPRPLRGLRGHAAGHTGPSLLRRFAETAAPRPWPEPGPGLALPPSDPPRGGPPIPAPCLPAPLAIPAAAASPGRWSLDAWAFWRQGSDAAPVSQGRVPIYGASQAGAVLHYRLAPANARDPRLYARVYRALVRRGESELALGAGLRPLPRLPLRVAGELRYTDGAFANVLRPAAYMVTEIPPLRLPLGAQLEAYGQAGWVGGTGATGFADGQTSITRALPEPARMTDNRLRLSLGAAAWGGAQDGAQRLDVGPTVRFDLQIGAVPARLSVDWRARVAGEAAPGSGVAATLSTQF